MSSSTEDLNHICFNIFKYLKPKFVSTTELTCNILVKKNM